ncbi:MAG: CoA-transferase [Methylocystis sp.]
MTKVTSASSAVALIKDGATLGASALGLAGWPEQVAIALERSFLDSGHPKGLTFVHASGIGDWKNKGTQHFAHPGLISRWIAAHAGLSPKIGKMITDEGFEAWCLPQGVISQLWREIAAHRPGLITKTGLKIFVDPRVQGGRLNQLTTKDIVKAINFEDEEWLFFASFKVDVAIIRGTTADEKGNMTVEDEGALLECLPLAQAAKNSGGIVIGEVEYIAENGSQHPKAVRVPGVLIDHLVISGPGNHWQSAGTRFNPAFAGAIRVPLDEVPAMPLNERLIIARRAAMELAPGCTVNLGIGVPEGLATVAAEEGVGDMITLTTEVGTIGGIPASGHDFGMTLNGEAFVEEQVQFDWYSGGGLDQAFLGAAQVDGDGNVNVSKFNGEFVACGGFIDITQHAKRVIYCGAFTAGGLKVSVENGKIAILKEGKAKKYVNEVEQITFSGAYATQTRQPVLFITERAVFELRDSHIALIEVAPGIDIETDILAHMEFKPVMSPPPKSMPAEIFNPKWGGLRKIFDAKKPKAIQTVKAPDHSARAG